MKSQVNKVFILDDETEYLHYHVEDLNTNGVEIDLYRDPVEAVLALSKNDTNYDVYIVDLIMSVDLNDSDHSLLDSINTPSHAYVENGLAMGRWVLDHIPSNARVLVLTNRKLSRISWQKDYQKKFEVIEFRQKQDTPAYFFYDELVNLVCIKNQ